MYRLLKRQCNNYSAAVLQILVGFYFVNFSCWKANDINLKDIHMIIIIISV